MNSAAATARRVSSIIATHPEEFDMEEWDCGTTKCIAGHVGDIHGDPFPSYPDGDATKEEWVDRQAIRLGLTKSAGSELFTMHYQTKESLAEILNTLADWHEQEKNPFWDDENTFWEIYDMVFGWRRLGLGSYYPFWVAAFLL